MRLIIAEERIVATATDDYSGPEQSISPPANFDPSRILDYKIVNGQLSIPAPNRVTMRQARLALLGAGYLAQVDAAVAGMPGVEGEAARIEWEYAAEVVRDSALTQAMAAVLGLTEAQMDALFVEAGKL